MPHLALRTGRALAAGLAALLVAVPAVGQDGKVESAGPYVPTPWVIVDEIMKLAGIGPGDYVIDLGSGDGRLVLTAVTRYKARGGFGVDIQAPLVTGANESARAAGVGERVRFEVRDLFVTPVAEANVVTLYLLPTSVPKLEAKLLAELAPGSRVVSHDYPFPDWPHDRFVKMDVPEKVAISGTPRTTLYLYTVPARIAGRWDVLLPGAATRGPIRLEIEQPASGARGFVVNGSRTQPVDAMRVHGNEVSVTLPAGVAGSKPIALHGKASATAIEGSGEGGAWRAVRAGR